MKTINSKLNYQTCCRYTKHLILLCFILACDKSTDTINSGTNYTVAREHIDNQNSGYLPEVLSPNRIIESSIIYESDFNQENTPVIWNDHMFIGDEFTFKSINLESGIVKWSFDTEDDVYSSAVLDNEILYFGDDSWYFYAVDANTGVDKWIIRANGNIRGTPIVIGDMVYFSDTYCCFYALNKNTGALIWSREFAFQGAAAMIDNKLIFGSETGEVHAVDPITGQDVWVFSDPNRSYITAGISGRNGKVIVPCGGGTVYSLNAIDGSIHWVFETDYRISFDACAAVTDDYVVLGSFSAAPQAVSSRIYCLDVDTGDVIWSKAFQDDNNRFAFVGSAIIANEVVVIGDISLGLHGLSLLTGEALWYYYDDNWKNIQATPTIYDGTIIIPFGSGRIHKLTYEE